MRLDLDHLETLSTVIDTGSFAKAAAKLNKARSAVSYDIRCLEEQLGVELLDRSGYRACLTVEGERIVREGRSLLIQARAIEHLAGLLKQSWETKVVMVTEGAIPMKPVFRAIQRFSEHDLPTLIELQTDVLGGVLERYERLGADLMLVTDFGAPVDEFTVDRLPNIHCVLVAASHHPLAKLKTPTITKDHIRQHLELNIQSAIRSELDIYDRRLGGNKVLNLGGFYDKKEALLMGLGFGWMPHTLVADELESGQLAVLNYEEGSTFEFTPSLMHRKDRPLGRAATIFRQTLLEEFSEIADISVV